MKMVEEIPFGARPGGGTTSWLEPGTRLFPDQKADRARSPSGFLLVPRPASMASWALRSVGASTQWIAAWQLRPHTTTPVVSAYLKNQQLLDEIPGRPVDSGGNLWIIVPQDEGVFQYSRLVKGLPLVSDVQVYLDLIDAGLRGPEAASELRKWEGFTR